MVTEYEKKIRLVMLERGIKMTDLAKQIDIVKGQKGISQNYLHDIITGADGKYETQKKIVADYLGV